MNLLTLSLSYIRQRKLSTLLNVLLLGLGIATIVVLLLFSRQMEDNLTRNGRNIDLVIGAKGSPLQLILSSIYQLDVPTGNIALKDARKIVSHPAVRQAIPLAMGDSYAGYRIIGCTAEYLQQYSAELQDGKIWQSPLQVIIGSAVAAEKGIKTGDRLISVHGMGEGGHAHGDQSLEVTGILAPSQSVLDRLILTSIQTVWAVHAPPEAASENEHADHDEDKQEEGEDREHHAESDDDHLDAGDSFPAFGRKSSFRISQKDSGNQLTAILVRFSSPIAAVTFPRLVNGQTSLQAASPAVETTRLYSLLGVGLDAIRAFAFILIAAAALSIFVALYNALRERRYDLAVMRSLGASRMKLLQHILLEGLLLSGFGVVVGLVLGHLATDILGSWFTQTQQMSISGKMFDQRELWLVAAALGIGIVAALLPAVQAYRTDISRTLAEG